MSRIDENRDFVPVRIAVLTVSDTRGLDEDRSGAVLVERLTAAGHVPRRPGGRARRAGGDRGAAAGWIADPGVDAVISTGGTGLTGRDVTVEAHEAVYEKAMPGFAILFTMLSVEKIGTSAIQSRACAGRRGGHLSLRAAGLALGLPRRLGRHPGGAARLPAPAVQLRRDHAAARGAQTAEVAQGTARDARR
jgi:molybdopterin adenylyltransferase